MRLIHLLRAVTVALCLSGCAESSFRLTQPAQIAAPLDRIFVLVGQGPFAQSYADQLAGALTTALCGHSTAARSRVLTGLELDDDPVSQQLRAFGAGGLLVVQPIGGELDDLYGTAPKIVYSATLLDIGADRVVWAGEVSHEGTAFSVGKRARLAADRIIGSLVEEKILRAGQPCQGGS